MKVHLHFSSSREVEATCKLSGCFVFFKKEDITFGCGRELENMLFQETGVAFDYNASTEQFCIALFGEGLKSMTRTKRRGAFSFEGVEIKISFE